MLEQRETLEQRIVPWAVWLGIVKLSSPWAQPLKSWFLGGNGKTSPGLP